MAASVAILVGTLAVLLLEVAPEVGTRGRALTLSVELTSKVEEVLGCNAPRHDGSGDGSVGGDADVGNSD